MKKLFTIFAAALVLAGCAQSFIEIKDNYITRSYDAELDGAAGDTKTTLEAGGKVSWAAGDVVRYYSKKNGTVGTATVDAATDHAQLELGVAETASFLIAVTGGTGITANQGSSLTIQGAVPAVQSGAFGDHHVALVKTFAVSSIATESLTFQNIVSYVKFTFTREDVKKVVFKANDGTKIHGGGVVNVRFVSDSEQISSVTLGSQGGSSITVNNGGAGTFYLAMLPCTLAKGFTVECYDAKNEYIGTATTDKSVTVGGSYILNLGNLDTRIERAYTDLSAAGTANCYIVSEAGDYKFKADVKGGSTQSLDGTPFRAEVLWESFGTDETPTAGDVVSAVTFKDGYIMFSSGRDGNAVIAVENRDEDILWSWHIWVCDGYKPADTDQVYNHGAGTMMDRNLGAMNADGGVGSFGLFYAWGRKDPFPGNSQASGRHLAATTITWPTAVASDDMTGTIEWTIQNPTTFITGNSGNDDWYYTGDATTDNTRWQNSEEAKGIYDPCPAGYRVPDDDTWSNAFKVNGEFIDSALWNEDKIAMDLGVNANHSLGASAHIWYPAAGYMLKVTSQNNVGEIGYWWSANANAAHPNFANNFSYNKTDSRFRMADVYYRGRCCGLSVRCVKEGSVTPAQVVKDLSSTGSANSYVVSKAGDYKFKTVKGNSTDAVCNIASVQVLWESYGTSTAPKVGDLVSAVSYDADYITFTASDKRGNAVIAAKDSAGNILWSWHIWLTEKPVDQVYNNNAGTMMDRNLGATSATPGDVAALGLLYQWGRKDPFLGGSAITYSSNYSQAQAASTGTWPEAVDSDAAKGTIEYTLAHPTTFVMYNETNEDWYYTGTSSTDNTRWASTKSMYDPCPVGYRVPDGGANGIWAKAFGSPANWTAAANFDSTNIGVNYGATDKKLGAAATIWYPAAGSIGYDDGELRYVARYGNYWSCTCSGNVALQLSFNSDGWTHPCYDYLLSYGRSVRCQKVD